MLILVKQCSDSEKASLSQAILLLQVQLAENWGSKIHKPSFRHYVIVLNPNLIILYLTHFLRMLLNLLLITLHQLKITVLSEKIFMFRSI